MIWVNIIDIEEKTIEVFELFDIARSQFDHIFLNGIDSVKADEYVKIQDLREKLSDMNLTLLSDQLGEFLYIIDKIKKAGKASQDLKKNASESALKLLMTTRIFERLMSIEISKKKLLSLG